MNTANASHKSPRKALVLCLLAIALSAAFLFFETALAQEGTGYNYVDLVMLHEVNPTGNNDQAIGYSVKNSGTATAIGVTVSFLLKDLQIHEGQGSPDPPDKITVNGTNQKFTWKAGNLLPGETSRPFVFTAQRHSGASGSLVGVITATASSVSYEPNALLVNNVAKVYSDARDGVSATKHIRSGKLGLLLSVDNLRPAVGGEVDFELTADNNNTSAIGHFSNRIANAKVKVELSKGLKFKTGWNPSNVDDVASDRQSATWSPPDTDTDGATTTPPIQKIDIETQLTSSDSLTDIPLEKRCITAWVEDSTPPPSASYPLNALTECLGDDPPVLLEEGPVAFLTSFPCIDDTHTDAHQCESVPGVAVAARLPSRYANYVEFDDFDANLRSHGVGRTDYHSSGLEHTVFLDPESVFIQVKDPEGRVQDSHTHSVSDVSWQTARQAITGKNRAVDGVTITYTRKDIKDASAWNSLGPRTLTVTRADGATPGKVKIRLNSNGNQFFDLSSGTQTKNAFNITSVSTSVVQYFAEFETLGTYLIDYSVTLTDSETTPNSYTDSGRYTFHVGPVAELEVRDGGASAELPAGQRAYTIMAVNNGPDAAPAVKVTLSGLSGYISYTATAGTFDSTTGVWTIGELITKDALQISRSRDSEVLTIITSAAADTKITAAISNTRDYAVCIDSSGNDVDAATESACKPDTTSTNTWHTAKYYDYISDNDTASIASRSGIKGEFTLEVTEDADKVTLSWPAQTTLTDGSAVASYGLLVSGDGGATWRALASRIQGTSHSAPSGALPFGDTRHYAVFAQNREGDRDLPFATAVVEDVVVRTRTETVVQTETVVETETVVRTETVAVPVPYFAGDGTTRTAAANIAPGSPVGAPVTVVRDPGNEVAYAYSLEGPDAALFTIDQDTGQILVGEGALLDFEYGTATYTVEVVATDPSSGDSVRTTVTIGGADDASETGFVFIDPAGAPQVGAPLFASLMHPEGDPVEPRWQWQRSMPDGTWADIPGAIQDIYIPTDLDAGRRLRALVVFGNPRGDGEGLAGAVTERVPGEAQVIPTAGTGATPEEVFGVLAHSLAAVWLYDNATKTWAVYSPWNPPETNDLKTVSRNDVVWMHIISEVQFQGNTLYPGWNLVIVS